MRTTTGTARACNDLSTRDSDLSLRAAPRSEMIFECLLGRLPLDGLKRARFPLGAFLSDIYLNNSKLLTEREL